MNEQISFGFSHNVINVMAGGLNISPLVDGVPQENTSISIGITEDTEEGKKLLNAVSLAISEFRHVRGI